MGTVFKGCLFATGFGIIAMPVAAHASDGESTGQPGDFRLGTGFSYSSGDYGETEDTDVFAVPVSLTYRRGGLKVRVSVPWVKVDGPGSLISTPEGRDFGSSQGGGNESDDSGSGSGSGNGSGSDGSNSGSGSSGGGSGGGDGSSGGSGGGNSGSGSSGSGGGSSGSGSSGGGGSSGSGSSGGGSGGSGSSGSGGSGSGGGGGGGSSGSSGGGGSGSGGIEVEDEDEDDDDASPPPPAPLSAFAPDNTRKGIGDVNVSAVYSFELGGDFYFEPGVKLKLPTASRRKRLGTGKVDVTLSADLVKDVGAASFYLHGRRKFAGKPANSSIRSTWGAGGGASLRVARGFSIGADYDWQQSAFAGRQASSEATVWAFTRLNRNLGMTFYASTGFNSNSADISGGASISYRF